MEMSTFLGLKGQQDYLQRRSSNGEIAPKIFYHQVNSNLMLSSKFSWGRTVNLTGGQGVLIKNLFKTFGALELQMSVGWSVLSVFSGSEVTSRA